MTSRSKNGAPILCVTAMCWIHNPGFNETEGLDCLEQECRRKIERESELPPSEIKIVEVKRRIAPPDEMMPWPRAIVQVYFRWQPPERRWEKGSDDQRRD